MKFCYNLLMFDRQESNCADTCDADRISVNFLPPRVLPPHCQYLIF